MININNRRYIGSKTKLNDRNVCSMPNFDANVFKEITGIEVTYNVD
jgi:hypothetical protein